ncbi:hypothetical protein G7046_g5565 [Stylonectria norvegica]|nr:hypothetical protein G7046_g5565 [Stylonectria norvegica]
MPPPASPPPDNGVPRDLSFTPSPHPRPPPTPSPTPPDEQARPWVNATLESNMLDLTPERRLQNLLPMPEVRSRPLFASSGSWLDGSNAQLGSNRPFAPTLVRENANVYEGGASLLGNLGPRHVLRPAPPASGSWLDLQTIESEINRLCHGYEQVDVSDEAQTPTIPPRPTNPRSALHSMTPGLSRPPPRLSNDDAPRPEIRSPLSRIESSAAANTQTAGRSHLGNGGGFREWASLRSVAQGREAASPVLETPPGLNIQESLAMRSQQAPSRGFRPMNAITQETRTPDTDGPQRLLPPGTAAFSRNYMGEHTIRNASIDCLPPDKNCALWLTNLPPDVTHNELLARIRCIGRVWCAVINKPDYVKHTTAAAKVVFFTPDAASRYLTLSLTQGLSIGGHQIKVTHNRVKYSEQLLVGNVSRVLIITGKSTFVNEDSLMRFFRGRFIFDVDEVVSLINVQGRSVVEFRFGSYRCQAQMGKIALEKDEPAGFEKVEFGEDPCEVGDTLSSYGVAGQRIQGRGI